MLIELQFETVDGETIRWMGNILSVYLFESLDGGCSISVSETTFPISKEMHDRLREKLLERNTEWLTWNSQLHRAGLSVL